MPQASRLGNFATSTCCQAAAHLPVLFQVSSDWKILVGRWRQAAVASTRPAGIVRVGAQIATSQLHLGGRPKPGQPKELPWATLQLGVVCGFLASAHSVALAPPPLLLLLLRSF